MNQDDDSRAVGTYLADAFSRAKRHNTQKTTHGIRSQTDTPNRGTGTIPPVLVAVKANMKAERISTRDVHIYDEETDSQRPITIAAHKA